MLVDWLKEQDVSVAAYEPTGGYERQLAKQLDEAGLIPHMVHPVKMRSLARARGFEAKTDGLDAQVLSLFGRTFPMADTQRSKPDPERAELRDLLRRRRQLVDQRVQELNRLDKGITKGSRTSTKRHIAWPGWRNRPAGQGVSKRPCKAARSCPVGLPFTRVLRAWAYSQRPSWRRTCRSSAKVTASV